MEMKRKIPRNTKIVGGINIIPPIRNKLKKINKKVLDRDRTFDSVVLKDIHRILQQIPHFSPMHVILYLKWKICLVAKKYTNKFKETEIISITGFKNFFFQETVLFGLSQFFQNVFFGFHFILKERTQKRRHRQLLVHDPHVLTSRDWARPKTRNSGSSLYQPSRPHGSMYLAQDPWAALLGMC